jgi:hypothetical protein
LKQSRKTEKESEGTGESCESSIPTELEKAKMESSRKEQKPQVKVQKVKVSQY